MVPSVADYEVRRELVQIGRVGGITSLDAWNALPQGRYVPLADSALRLGVVVISHKGNVLVRLILAS